MCSGEKNKFGPGGQETGGGVNKKRFRIGRLSSNAFKEGPTKLKSGLDEMTKEKGLVPLGQNHPVTNPTHV